MDIPHTDGKRMATSAELFMLGKMEDVNMLKSDNIDLKVKSTRDDLTGLFNRRALGDKLKQLGKDEVYTIIMFDLDLFKNFNDTYGHVAGDVALQRLAKVLTDNFRSTDFIARYGGEEFVVILEGDLSGVPQICEDVRKKIEDSHIIPEERRQDENSVLHPITSSIGFATFTGDEEPKSVINKADIALYHAKDGGRNRVVEYKDGMTMPAKK